MIINGIMVQYFVACKRELWLFLHKINFNEEDENIKLGKLIHRLFFKRQKRNLNIDDVISIDLTKKDENLIVVEVKKSSKLPDPVRYQLLYYLWYLKHKKGIVVDGLISYPTERKTEKIILTPEKEMEIENILENINKIAYQREPPKAVKLPYCRKCSYFEFCWVK
jgi:CRISPR-associated exonuclease Cas4